MFPQIRRRELAPVVDLCEAFAMRIHVDSEKCEGHNRCYSIVSELFDVDDYGYATAAGEGVVPAELADKARLTADNCPEYAITVSED